MFCWKEVRKGYFGRKGYFVVFADKTRNIYETSLDTYNKTMHDNITKAYKHGSEGTISQIDDELKHISNNLGIGEIGD